MTPEERYLFDVQGYLVVENALDGAEVAELNALLDDYDLWRRKGTERFFELWTNDPDFLTVGPLHRWDEPFRRLIAHPKILPYLAELCGPKFRYDHGHTLLMRRGATHLRLHGGGTPFRPDSYYLVRDGVQLNGLLAVSYALTDAEAGKGGFAAIPGSHKAAFPCPDPFITFEETGPWVVHVPARAGSAIVFTEALTHGTWPWTADYERRSVLCKYCPGHIAWAGDTPDATRITRAELGAEADGWSDELRRLLTPPYVAGRPDAIESR
jgi:ectoine hydroxylase-related dioxygenase (phytanoyl-CoA dioxygenase family)